jgi:hypothetical protein
MKSKHNFKSERTKYYSFYAWKKIPNLNGLQTHWYLNIWNYIVVKKLYYNSFYKTKKNSLFLELNEGKNKIAVNLIEYWKIVHLYSFQMLLIIRE